MAQVTAKGHYFTPGQNLSEDVLGALKVRFWPFLDHLVPFWGLLDQNWGKPRTHNWVKTSTRTSSNLFHAVPTVLEHQSAPARVLKPTSIIGHKMAILGNRGQKTARRAAERAPSGKPKVSRVTSGYRGVVIPLSRDRPSQKKGGFIGVA